MRVKLARTLGGANDMVVLGLKPRRTRRGRPRVGETALSRWIDANMTGAEELPRAQFAKLANISRVHVDRLCHGARTPGLTLALKIERITLGAVSVQEWTDDSS